MDSLLSGDGDLGELVSGPLNNIPVSRAKILCLCDREWLNDEVINFYLELLKRHNKMHSNLPKAYFFNTFFYAQLFTDRGRYNYDKVRRWTRKAKIFENDLLIFPINKHRNHWTLASVDFKRKTFTYYDSLRVCACPAWPACHDYQVLSAQGGDEGTLHHLYRWMVDEHLDKLQSSMNWDGWRLPGRRERADKSSPLQTNGYDCGMLHVHLHSFADAMLLFLFQEFSC